MAPSKDNEAEEEKGVEGRFSSPPSYHSSPDREPEPHQPLPVQRELCSPTPTPSSPPKARSQSPLKQKPRDPSPNKDAGNPEAEKKDAEITSAQRIAAQTLAFALPVPPTFVPRIKLNLNSSTRSPSPPKSEVHTGSFRPSPYAYRGDSPSRKRSLSGGNPNEEPLGKRRAAGPREEVVDDDTMEIIRQFAVEFDGSYVESPALQYPPLAPRPRPPPRAVAPTPRPPPRLKCSRCDLLDLYCSLEDSHRAFYPCTSCAGKHFCQEQVQKPAGGYKPVDGGGRKGSGGGGGGGLDLDGMNWREEATGEKKAGTQEGGKDQGGQSSGGGGAQNGVTSREVRPTSAKIGTVLGMLVGKMWANCKKAKTGFKSIFKIQIASS